MPRSQEEHDRKCLAAIKEAGGEKYPAARLHREDVKVLDFLARYYSMDKGTRESSQPRVYLLAPISRSNPRIHSKSFTKLDIFSKIFYDGVTHLV